MTQSEEKATTVAASERAEQIVTRAGERLGRLAGKAVMRVQQAAQGFREEADDMDALETTSEKHEATTPSAQNIQHPPTTERAEELVDQFLQRASHWAVVGNLQARKTLARLREDAEDIWVEAQGMRGSWGRKRERK